MNHVDIKALRQASPDIIFSRSSSSLKLNGYSQNEIGFSPFCFLAKKAIVNIVPNRTRAANGIKFNVISHGGGSFRYLIWHKILRFLAYHTVSDGNSSPTYRWAIALHTIEVGVSLPILDESYILSNYEDRLIGISVPDTPQESFFTC